MGIHHSKANTIRGAPSMELGQSSRTTVKLFDHHQSLVVPNIAQSPTNDGNRGRYRVGLLGYYTCVENRPPFRERKPSLEELMNKHIQESTRKRNENEEWMKKLQETTDMNIRNRNAALKNLETLVDQLTKDFQVSKKDKRPSGVLPCQPPPKELSIGSFTLPCTIGSLNMYALAYLNDSVNIMPYSMFKCLKLISLKETSMLVEKADKSKKAHIGIVENVLAKIDKFVFPSDFVVIDMLKDPNETMILGRPFLATIHARRNVFHGEILLGIGEDRIMFDMNGNVHHPTMAVEKFTWLILSKRNNH
ncbi:reverse transcriptase domain-containing protein [Tanacetum coccineum]